ncbi:hypothetical protein Hokovirus_3_71 [Hokovirus HKV1]|uniref:Ankyrin repeat protein n=1 Tax=Hokovirus HKV1 TaxID=1977638 RepID=A0A1V0SGP0_9VIRU|nr:hypothetical protein Hokovirus_3_71 [Hokovirus HKV1]
MFFGRHFTSDFAEFSDVKKSGFDACTSRIKSQDDITTDLFVLPQVPGITEGQGYKECKNMKFKNKKDNKYENTQDPLMVLCSNKYLSPYSSMDMVMKDCNSKILGILNEFRPLKYHMEEYLQQYIKNYKSDVDYNVIKTMYKKKCETRPECNNNDLMLSLSYITNIELFKKIYMLFGNTVFLGNYYNMYNENIVFLLIKHCLKNKKITIPNTSRYNIYVNKNQEPEELLKQEQVINEKVNNYILVKNQKIQKDDLDYKTILQKVYATEKNKPQIVNKKNINLQQILDYLLLQKDINNKIFDLINQNNIYNKNIMQLIYDHDPELLDDYITLKSIIDLGFNVNSQITSKGITENLIFYYLKKINTRTTENSSVYKIVELLINNNNFNISNVDNDNNNILMLLLSKLDKVTANLVNILFNKTNFSKSFDINNTNINNETCISILLKNRKNNEGLVDLIIGYIFNYFSNVDISQTDFNNKTIIEKVIETKNIQLFKLFINNNTCDRYTSDNIPIIQYLLKLVDKDNTYLTMFNVLLNSENVNLVDCENVNLLILICNILDNIPLFLVKKIINLTLNLDICDVNGYSALDYCIIRNKLNIASILIKKGLKFNDKIKDELKNSENDKKRKIIENFISIHNLETINYLNPNLD